MSRQYILDEGFKETSRIATRLIYNLFGSNYATLVHLDILVRGYNHFLWNREGHEKAERSQIFFHEK